MDILNQLAKDHQKWIDVVKLFGIHQDAEDVVQEMYLKIANSNIKEERNYNGYVYICLRNIAYTIHKNKKYNCEINEEITEDNNYADNRLNWIDVQKALHKLPIFQRQVIQLNNIEGISMLEIQRNTNICRIKMSKEKNKGLKQLKKILEL